ncbi:MAG: acid-resistance protein, partial [Hafnia sp.]
MLNIDRKSLLGLDGNFLKKQRTLLLVISFLLLLGGIF